MKIVHIEDFFHPDAGYQINIISKLMVNQGHEVTIITSQIENHPDKLTKFFGKDHIEEKDRQYTEQYGVKIIRLPLVGYIANRAILSGKLFKTIREERPDVVFVHGNDSLTGMRMLLRYHRESYPMMMDSHMLEMASRSRFNRFFRSVYRRLFTPIILKNHIYVIRTQDDPYVEKCLGIPLEIAPWISVGSDTMLFRPNDELRSVVRDRLGISDEAFVIIYAGKMDAAKGGMFLAESIKDKFTVQDKEIVFLIIGNTVGEYGDMVEQTLGESQNRVIRLPSQKYVDLEQYYAASDLSVFPKQCSLSFYDVQASGLPVISEGNSINIDRCSHGNGATFEPESMDDFREKIMQFASMDKESIAGYSKRSIEYIESGFDYVKIAREYTSYLEKSIDFYKKRKKN